MKIKSIIAILILAVYSIVIAHSFIPHHHHSEYTPDTQVCQVEKQHEKDKHADQHFSNCCVDHDHNDHTTQNHCSFNEKTILEKSRNLSAFIIPFTEIEFDGLEKKIQSISEGYIPIKIFAPHCRDLQLRGPPQFS